MTSGAKVELSQLQEENRSPILVTRNKEEKKEINKWLQDLLRAGVITLSKHEEGEFIPGIFARQKSDGTHRMILNLKEFNTNVEYKKFKLKP